MAARCAGRGGSRRVGGWGGSMRSERWRWRVQGGRERRHCYCRGPTTRPHVGSNLESREGMEGT